jgi:DNA-binding NtrC family response regulator
VNRPASPRNRRCRQRSRLGRGEIKLKTQSLGSSTLTPALLSPEIQASRRTVAASPPPTEPEIRLRLDQPLPEAVEMLEQSMIRRALERSHGRVEEAAWLLGISRKGLFLKRRRRGLQQQVS